MKILLILAAIVGCCTASLVRKIRDQDLDRMLDDAETLHRLMISSAPRSHFNNQTRFYKKKTNPLVLEHGIKAAAFAHASANLAKKYGLSRDEADRRLESRATSRKTGLTLGNSGTCLFVGSNAACSTTNRYRTADGSCNNLIRPRNGMALNAFDRFVAPNYGDGVSTLRLRSDGGQLLSPRIISLIIHPDVGNNHQFVTHMAMMFGQFVDHDLTSTPEFTNMQCCSNPQFAQCMPISVPSNDPFYAQFGVNCIDIGRSIPACGTGQREQINQVSAFIDASQVYGNSDSETNALRNGFLLLTDTNTQLLPKDFQSTTCGIPAQNIICFKAGDDRVNENPALTSLHTLFVREHNRIATILRNSNPSWTDEQVFQETRRIVIAEKQNIIFNEYLPVILGSTVITNFGLNLPNPGAFSTYDSSVVPGTFNSFATAAYRFGHTLIQNSFTLTGGTNFLLEQNFQNPQVIYQNVANIDRILMGGTQQPAQKYDNFIAQAVTNHLFQTNNQFGSDLASLNVQRGRDHGLPSYNAFRSACGFNIISSYQDLVNAFGSTSTADRFMDAYGGVFNDIDLWPAGVSELPVSGGVVGSTFACIISRQYKRLFSGDRFFFTHSGQTGSFRSSQLTNLRQRTLAGVMCDNLDQTIVNSPQQNVFLQGQTAVPCANQPKLNLVSWVLAGM